MKLNNIFFIALFINVLSLGSQLLCQEVPEITYHAHIAPLAQHAAQTIATRLFKKPYKSDISQALSILSTCEYKDSYVNSAKHALAEIGAIEALTHECCIAKDNPDALAYCFEQTPVGSLRKNAQSLKQLADSAIKSNAPLCLKMLVDHVDSPEQLTTKQQLLDAIKNGAADCVRSLLPFNNPEIIYEVPCYDPNILHEVPYYLEDKSTLYHDFPPKTPYYPLSPFEQTFKNLEDAEKTEKAEKNGVILTDRQKEYLKKPCAYKSTISLLLAEIPNTIKQKEGESALNLAIRYNAPVSLIEQIIALDSSLVNKQHYYKTPLYTAVNRAIESENNEVVELLLAKGAQPNLDEDSPLDLATQKLCPDLVRLLIQTGATPTKITLMNALKQLREKTNTSDEYKAKKHKALYEILEILIPASSKELLGKPGILNQLVVTALARNKVSLISLALEQDLDLQQPLNEKGETALHIAITYKSIAATEALLQAGCNPELTTKEEETPLSYTAWCEKQSTTTPCMERLLAANVALDKADIHGNTALHIAAYNNNYRGTFLLLKHGADQDIKNNDGKTAYEIAQPGAKAMFDSFALGKQARQS